VKVSEETSRCFWMIDWLTECGDLKIKKNNNCASDCRPSLEKNFRPWNFYWTIKNITAVFSSLCFRSFTENHCLHLVWNVAVTLLKFSWALFSVSVCFYETELLHNITRHIQKNLPLSPVPSFLTGCNRKRTFFFFKVLNPIIIDNLRWLIHSPKQSKRELYSSFADEVGGGYFLSRSRARTTGHEGHRRRWTSSGTSPCCHLEKDCRQA